MELRGKLLLFVWFAAMIGVLIYTGKVQIFEHKFWVERAKEERIRGSSYSIPRGKIFDRNGLILAYSAERFSVFADPVLVKKPEYVALRLSQMFKLDEKKLLKKLTDKNRRFVWIKRAITKEEKDKLKALKLKGIFFKKEYKRIYPFGTVGRQIIGSVGVDNIGFLDNRGLFGLEKKWNKYLEGVVNFKGRETGLACDVYTTLDIKVQQVAEEVLKRAYEKWRQKAAYVVVLNPSFEVVAAASWPMPENEKECFLPKKMRAGCFFNVFEPGSVVKPLIFKWALEKGVVRKSDRFYCPGYIYVVPGKYKISCYSTHNWIDAEDVITYSCNVGAIKIALKLGKQELYSLFRRLGFGEKTSLDFVGEEDGILRDIKKWNVVSVASVAIGQEFAVTAIQMIRALMSLFSNGEIASPNITKMIVARDGKVIKEENKKYERVFTPDMGIVHDAMERVVERGTGKRARIKGLTIYGKTGTAQKAGPKGYEKGKYVVSFFGYVKEMGLGFYVVVDEPRGKGISGGKVAAAMFANIVRRLYEDKEYRVLSVNVPKKEEEEVFYKIPDFKGKTIFDVVKRLTGRDTKLIVHGSGVRVVKQKPQAGSEFGATLEVWVK